MLEMLFDAGRVSNRTVLQSIFSRTPRGRAQAESVRDVNRALESLRGQTLASLRIASAGPSRHALVLETDRCRLTVEFARGGPSVTSLEVG